MLEQVIVQASFSCIFQAPFPDLGSHENLLVKVRRFLVHLHQRIQLDRLILVFLGHGDIGEFRYSFNAFWKSNFFLFHDELVDIAAFMAAKAVEELLVRVDAERGGIFLMKRAKTNIVFASLLQ